MDNLLKIYINRTPSSIIHCAPSESVVVTEDILSFWKPNGYLPHAQRNGLRRNEEEQTVTTREQPQQSKKEHYKVYGNKMSD